MGLNAKRMALALAKNYLLERYDCDVAEGKEHLRAISGT